MGRPHGKLLAAVALLGLALPATVAARPAALAPTEWKPPTPAEGERFTAVVGKELAFSLAATAPGAPAVSVSIHAAGMPPNARLESTTGNPATATINWTPARSQAGKNFKVAFTAQPTAPGIAPAARN